MHKQHDLYVFSHIPKTAGSNFLHSIELSRGPHFLLRAGYSYRSQFRNQHTGKIDFYDGKEHFVEYVNSLSGAQKDKIHCLTGHDSYYGIHELFNKPARYITFIREPVSRTLSLYNYIRHRCELEKNDAKKPTIQKVALKETVLDNFLVDGVLPDFETWLHNVYNQRHIFYQSQTNYLQYLNFIGKNRDEESIQDSLRKFYFVGITELYDTDSAYLYNHFRVNSLRGIKNISPKFVRKQDLTPHLIQRIEALNQEDMLLYECALRENAAFKKNTKDFYVKVAETKRRRRLYYPIELARKVVIYTLRPILKPILIQLGWR